MLTPSDAYPEVEAFLMHPEGEAAGSVRASLLLWSVGLVVICVNLAVNPYWEGPWYEKLWLPAVYVGALALLLVSKFNRLSEYGRIVFERDFIRVVPRAGERQVFRVRELHGLELNPGRAGFLRNPLKAGSVGTLRFEQGGVEHLYFFRLRRHDHVEILRQFGLVA